MKQFYENPLCARYADREMKAIFSPDEKFSTFRKLWVALAESERELGLDIKQSQIDEMKANVYNIDYDIADAYVKALRHEVIAHSRALGDQCPNAKPIIHLGATSCFVGDNTDVILMKKALIHIRKLLVNLIAEMAEFAKKHKKVYCLAYTHFQAAQPTTIGKRATLWIYDLMSDLDRLDYTVSDLKLLGCKGTTGTSASFLELFEGDTEKVKRLEKLIAEKMGFSACQPVSGQTYSRKTDYFVLSVLSGIAQSLAKFSSDIRLMCHEKEFDEPFESGQVGSSAMAYKKNPMRSERIASLARYVIVDAMNPAITSASQWLERTLDDSANKRISVPEAFLATDAILTLAINIIRGGTVYPKMAEANLKREMPFMATENILMYCVKRGGDRQELHERIRTHSMEVTKNIKLYGKENDLLDRILADKAFDLTKEQLDSITSAENFSGCAVEQVDDYVETFVRPMLIKNAELIGVQAKVEV
ncbi:MAG: adenylosuccinate lyase [Clostridia bacterium]|nr:adenylosuccinate lyase [Clostridia bacterium]